jgi:hypothetical protein
VRRLLVIASIVPSSPILVTLMKKALSSFLTRAIRRNIPEDAILQEMSLLITVLDHEFFTNAGLTLPIKQQVFSMLEW